MLVRAGDGEWLQLRPVGELPPGGFRAVCGHDAANLLELDEPMPVVKFAEDGSDGMVDAICLTHDGGIALLAATFGEEPRDTLWRLANIAGMLRGMSLEVFAANCTEVQGTAPAQWLADRVGGDAGMLEARMAHVLETGAFDLVLVTASGAGTLAMPMRFLQAGPAQVRVYEVEILRAGEVQAIEGVEVTLEGERAEGAPPRRAEVVAEPVAAAPAPQPEPAPEPMPEVDAVAEVEPQIEPVAVVEPEPAPLPEPVAELVEEPVAPVAEEIEEAPLGEPSDEAEFLAAIDRLDHRSSALMRFLHGRLLTYVGEREYTRDAKLEYFVGWTREAPHQPLVGLDSAGAFTVVLASLPEHEQAEYAAELAGLLPDGDAARLLELGVAELSVLEHLNDETLLEYVIDNFAEALPGGRAAFEEAAEPVADADAEHEHEDEDDFFAGVSAGHDPAEIAEAVSSQLPEPGPADTPSAVAPPAAEHENQGEQPQRGGFARRLRRRDAA